MKKSFIFALSVVLVLLLVGCQSDNKTTCNDNEAIIDGTCQVVYADCADDEYYVDSYCLDNPDTIVVDIYYLNDFHGAIMHDGDEIGLAKISNFFKTRKMMNPNTIIISGGDMLQGSALSNYYSGLSTIEIMDEIGFSALILGNHEFDWGLETVTQYFDENEMNGEADFPLLSSNVFNKNTVALPEYIDPYTVVTVEDVTIGIIGYLGYGLERSIATSRVEDYEIKQAVPYISEHAATLRTTYNVDIVLAVGHATSTINSSLINLQGSERVDAIFNAHSHSVYSELNPIPVIQSGSNGEFIGHVQLHIVNGDVTAHIVENISLYDDALLNEDDEDTVTVIESYLSEIETVLYQKISSSQHSYSKSDLSNWMADIMRVKTGSDIAFHNYGGTRRSIEMNEEINLSMLYEIWPFDNVIKTVYLTGSQINTFIKQENDTVASTLLTVFEDDTLYKVATNDYIFDKTNFPFIGGDNPEYTGIFIRDLAVEELVLQHALYGHFDMTNPILLTVD